MIPRVECPTCKGKGTDPRKRKRACPETFCRGGEIPSEDPCCSCECHDKPGVMHVQPCCAWSGYRRMDMPLIEAVKPKPIPDVPMTYLCPTCFESEVTIHARSGLCNLCHDVLYGR